MALVLRYIFEFYNHHFNDNLDSRIKGLFLLESPAPVLLIIIAYLYFVLGIGQKWMKQRKAFELNGIINVYNITQVLLCLYIGIGVRK